MIEILFLAALSHATERIKPPSSSTVMNCGQPDPRETAADGTYTCTNYYKKDVPNAKFTVKNGKLEGKALGYRENGEPEFDGAFKNGEQEGEIKTSWSEKEKRFRKVTHFKAGKREGVETEQTGNGDDMNVRFYKNDQLHGYSYFLHDAKIDFISDCRIEGRDRAPKEKCEGLVIPGYEKQWAQYQEKQKQKGEKATADANREVIRKNRDGVVIERYTLKNSQTWGKHERFFDNGKPYLVSDEEASRKLNETEYFEDGNLKRKSVYDPKARSETKHEEFYQNGKPKLSWTRDVNPDRTTTMKFKEYYDNGQLQTEGVRKGTVFSSWGGDYDGEIKLYSEEGQLVGVEHYKDRKKDGLQRYETFSENKVPLILEQTYAKGVLQKIITQDKASKKTQRIQDFFPDGSTKSDQKF